MAPAHFQTGNDASSRGRTIRMNRKLFVFLKGIGNTLARLILAVGIAALVLTGACLLNGCDLKEALQAFFLGPLDSGYELGEILRETVPLIFTGTAVSIMVRCGQFNMFVEGAFFGGAFMAGVLAPIMGENPILTPLFAIMAGTVLMGIIGWVPAKMKAALGVNEFVSSLMLNYIVFWVCMYLLHGAAGDPDRVNATRYLEEGMKLPFLNEDIELSSNILIALAAAVLGGIFLFCTRWGYRIRMTGDAPAFAGYAGINSRHCVVSSQVIGSALAGAGGASFLLGNYYRFEWTTLPNYGFDGFVIAIIAGNNPFFVPLAGLFLAYLRVGALEVSRTGEVPNEVIYVIQAIIIILFGAKLLISRNRRGKGGKKNA